MPKILGYGGLIPFVAFSVLVWIDRDRMIIWHGYLLSYGAVILTFVGASHWGFAVIGNQMPRIRRDAMFLWSVIPSLMAFLALAMGSVAGSVLMVTGFVLQYVMDMRASSFVSLPDWYLPLRSRLSTIVVICLISCAFAKHA